MQKEGTVGRRKVFAVGKYFFNELIFDASRTSRVIQLRPGRQGEISQVAFNISNNGKAAVYDVLYGTGFVVSLHKLVEELGIDALHTYSGYLGCHLENLAEQEIKRIADYLPQQVKPENHEPNELIRISVNLQRYFYDLKEIAQLERILRMGIGEYHGLVREV